MEISALKPCVPLFFTNKIRVNEAGGKWHKLVSCHSPYEKPDGDRRKKRCQRSIFFSL